MGRDHRTIKCFVANSKQGRKKRIKKKRRKLSAKDLRRIKREDTRNPLSYTAAMFQNCNLPRVSRSTRCSVLRDMAKARKAETPPSLNKTCKLKCQDLAKKYLKTNFLKVLWTDEVRVTLDGPNGWVHGWISNGHRAQLSLRCQQGGGGVLV